MTRAKRAAFREGIVRHALSVFSDVLDDTPDVTDPKHWELLEQVMECEHWAQTIERQYLASVRKRPLRREPKPC